MKVTIVGSGLGGALTARVLRSQHSVTVLERTPSATEFSAALLIGPSNMLFLDSLGLERTNIGCNAIDLIRIWAKQEVLIHERELDWKEVYGDHWQANDRAALRNEFVRLATAPSAELGIEGEPAEVVFGAEVVDVDCDSGVVTCKDGRTFESDVVIGADGINSNVRPLVLKDFPQHPGPKPSTSSAFRFSIATEMAQKLYPKLFDKNRPACLTLLAAVDGSHRSMAIYPYRNGGEYMNFVVIVPDTVLNEEAGERSETRGVEEILGHFHDFPDGIKDIFRAADSIRLWQIRHQDPLPTYVRGRVVLMGDAAHAMVPQQTQGGNQAIEDAEGFTLLNASSATRENVNEVLKQWERVRRPRATIVQDLSSGILSSMDITTVYKHGPFYWSYPGIVESLKKLDAGEEITYAG